MEEAVRQTRPAPWVRWRELAGIALAPGQAPPADEQVERWLDERRVGYIWAGKERTMTTIPSDREAILKAVHDLPPGEQLDLAREIMRRYMEASVQQTPPAKWVSWRELAGIALAPGQEPPTDEQVEQWLDERRMKEAE